MNERTYVHHDSRDAKGHHRPTSWHIVKAPLAHARYYATYCRPEFVADDVMTETPNAATCESCYRNEAKARERAGRSEDPAHWWPVVDASTQPAEN